jgi:hypothetical protein
MSKPVAGAAPCHMPLTGNHSQRLTVKRLSPSKRMDRYALPAA